MNDSSSRPIKKVNGKWHIAIFNGKYPDHSKRTADPRYPTELELETVVNRWTNRMKEIKAYKIRRVHNFICNLTNKKSECDDETRRICTNTDYSHAEKFEGYYLKGPDGNNYAWIRGGTNVHRDSIWIDVMLEAKGFTTSAIEELNIDYRRRLIEITTKNSIYVVKIDKYEGYCVVYYDE